MNPLFIIVFHVRFDGGSRFAERVPRVRPNFFFLDRSGHAFNVGVVIGRIVAGILPANAGSSPTGRGRRDLCPGGDDGLVHRPIVEADSPKVRPRRRVVLRSVTFCGVFRSQRRPCRTDDAISQDIDRSILELVSVGRVDVILSADLGVGDLAAD